MFDLVRKNKLLLQIMLVLMIIPFAFFGLESYTRTMGGAGDVASVDGQSITTREFSEELRQQLDRIRGLLGRGADASSFDTPDARSGLLDSMIDRRVLAAAAVRSRLSISDEQLREMIAGMEPFQVDGRFSKASYEALLLAQNMTPAGFESRMRYDLTLSQLSRAVSGSAIQARAVAERVLALGEQAREIEEVMVQAQPFLAQIKIDEAGMKAYYDANPGEFRTPELIKAEYLLFSAEQLGALAPPTEDELKAAYAARAAEFVQLEQRRVSHILIPVAADATPADKQVASKKIEVLLAEIRKSPARFAALAKQNSQDPGSADKGGDLGLVGPGMMVKPFEDAVFKLKNGETSDVVETEFGYHLIHVTGIQPGKTRTLDEVKGELAKDVARQKGAKSFAEAAEVFSNLVYEQSDSLKPAAERFKLAIQHTDWISKTPSPAAGTLAHPRILGMLFTADAIQSKRNTDAVEIAQNVLVSARVTEHRPAAQLKFEEVKAEIETHLRRQEALKLARTDGAAKLEQLKTGKDAGLKWSRTRTISRANAQGLPPEALRQILAADAAKLPAYVGVDLEGGYALYRVAKVIEVAPKSEAEKKSAMGQLDSQAGAEQFAAYIASLRARAKVEVNKENLGNKPQP